jgi:GNAT superfamily N-acetyltransferase
MAAREPRNPVTVVDLTPELEPLYLVCLEDWPGSDVREAGDHKARWLERMRGQGLVVKLALDGAGRPAGMIQCVPIERSPALGRGLLFVLCIWVLPRSPAGPSRRLLGLGAALLQAAEGEARARGLQGVAAWGLALPMWMKASWFRRHGFRTADRQGLSVLLWKPFGHDAERPRWPARTGKIPAPAPGKVVVSACLSGWCPAQSLAYERARRAAEPFGDRVEVRLVDTGDRATMLEWGCSDALFVDGRQVRTGPPPSQEKLAALLRRRVARLRVDG